MNLTKLTKPKIWVSALASIITLIAVTPLSIVAQTTIAQQQSKTSQEWSVNGVLKDNDEILSDGSYFQLHTFSGEAGETIAIEVSSSEFDSYLIVLDPEENKIAEDDDGGEGNQAKVTISLTISGTYTVIVTSYEAEETGSYQLRVRAATVEDVQLAQVEQLTQQAWELYQQGKYSDVIPLAQEALRIRQQVLGDEHPYVALSLNNLAVLYFELGRYSEAELLYKQALEMYRRLVGPEHPDVATSLNNLAALYSELGRYSEAEPLLIQALEMTRRLVGLEHPDVALSLG